MSKPCNVIVARALVAIRWHIVRDGGRQVDADVIHRVPEARCSVGSEHQVAIIGFDIGVVEANLGPDPIFHVGSAYVVGAMSNVYCSPASDFYGRSALNCLLRNGEFGCGKVIMIHHILESVI